MKAHVDKGTDGAVAGGRALHVVEAQRHLVAAEQVVDAIVIPARIAELDRVPVPLRKRPQEMLEPFQVDREARRKLVEDRAEVPPEVPGVLEETRRAAPPDP